MALKKAGGPTAGRCSFCGKGKRATRVMVVAPDGHSICDACAKNASLVLGSFETPDAEDAPTPLTPPPTEAKVIKFVDARALRLTARRPRRPKGDGPDAAA